MVIVIEESRFFFGEQYVGIREIAPRPRVWTKRRSVHGVGDAALRSLGRFGRFDVSIGFRICSARSQR